MGHGTFIFPDEFTLLHEYDGPGEFGGPPTDWVAKGWMDANDILAWFWDYDGLLPDLTAVVRDYAHIGKDGCVFFHEAPKGGRFKVTRIAARSVKYAAGVAEGRAS